jgi:outer membrane biosynthesis protein TonB
VPQTRSSHRVRESDPLWGAAIVSASLHVGALAAALVVWPSLAPPVIQTAEAIPVDLVTLADETNVRPQEAAPEPLPEPPPQPEIVAAQESMPDEAPPPPPPEQEGFVEEKIDEQPKPEPKKPEPPKPEPPKPEPPKPEPKLAMAEPKPKPEKPKEKKKPSKDEFDLDRITSLIDKMDKSPPAAETREGAKPTAQKSVRGVGAQSAMTATEIDALRAQLRKCWNVPVGAPDPSALVFRMRIFLNPDGSVASQPELIDQGGLADPYFRAAVDSARRAVLMCSPFQLPPEKYDTWNDITITFDPTRMAGY